MKINLIGMKIIFIVIIFSFWTSFTNLHKLFLMVQRYLIYKIFFTYPNFWAIFFIKIAIFFK